MKKILLFFVWFCQFSMAQTVNNQLNSFYKADSDTLLYESFQFDGNGKVTIPGMAKAYFFQKGDSLIVFTQPHSILKFISEKNKIKGVSDLVQGGTWTKKDSLIPNKRTDNALAQRNANLLSEYYHKTNFGKKLSDYNLDEEEFEKINSLVKDLCDRGLAKSCLEILQKDISNEYFDTYSKKNIPENPNIITLAQKVIAMDEEEGHTQLGKYYFYIGKKDLAMAEWEKGIAKGSYSSDYEKMGVEFEDELQKSELQNKKKRKPQTKKKK